MKKSLLLLTGALIAVSASRVTAQPKPAADAAPLTAPGRGVSVIGSIAKPGNYPLVAGENVAALLKRVGGATSAAAPKKAYLLREGVSVPVDFSQPAEKLQKMQLREGDVLVVPATLSRIFVMGDVANSGYFTLPEGKGASVADAIVLAGGLNLDSKDARFAIIRGTPNADLDWHPYPKDKSDALLRAPLQDGDGVYVERVAPDSAPAEGGLQLLENQQK